MLERYCTAVPETAFLVEAEESLVLIGASLLRLGPLATQLMIYCYQPRTLEEMVQHCLEIFDQPPAGNATEILTTCTEALIAAKALRIEEAE